MESRRCIFAHRMCNFLMVQRWIPPILDVSALGLIIMLPRWFPQWHCLGWPWTLAGLVFFVPGMILMAAALFLFRRHRTTLVFEKPDTLITVGIFRWTRNPMYVGKFLFFVGLAWLLGNFFSLVAALLHILLVAWLVVPKEERLMQETFGEDYRVYANQVGRWFCFSRYRQRKTLRHGCNNN